MVLLHPSPLTVGHIVLVPNRVVKSDEDAGEDATGNLFVPPSDFRADASEDLGLEHFLAAAEALLNFERGGVVTWCGIRGDTEAAEFRNPLDTHLQVLPFPLSGDRAAVSPLRY